MTEAEFDNGYWYADDLKKFAEEIGVPSARRLRKDELERAVKHFLRTGEAKSFAKRTMTKSGPRDIDLGLRLDLPVVHYTSNRQTKDFIEHEAAKLEPGFRRKSGTRYLLNRWREEQLGQGRRITRVDQFSGCGWVKPSAFIRSNRLRRAHEPTPIQKHHPWIAKYCPEPRAILKFD